MRRSQRARKPRGDVRTHYFALRGGLDLVSAPMAIKEGRVIDATNYEQMSEGGYRRINGYERYDGQDKPTDASYWVLNFDGGTTAISEGDVVTGLTSGASGTCLIDAQVTSGSWATNDAAGYLVLTAVTGDPFTDNEELQVSAATRAIADGVEAERGASSSTDDATWAQDAIETQRDKIGMVGASDGSGPIRGAHIYKGVVYAFRDNTAGTECLMWKATSAGWVQQSLGNRVDFTAGTAEFQEGETLTGGTSAATATINRVVVQSGDWSSLDAAGYLVIGDVTSGPYQAETGTSASGSATLSGAETANTLAAGGRFEFRNHNFFGSSQTKRMYGVDGASYAFEWDGSVFVPIITGNTVDTPSHLEIHYEHLFLVFANGSLQNSATGTPYVWAGSGAAEIGVGDDITGIARETGGTMAVLSRSKTQILYGTDSTEWDLKTIDPEAGGIEWTIQRLGSARYLDDRGLTTLAAVDTYGDFENSVFSQLIEPIITAQKNNALSSCVIKSKNQYRLFFNDGTGIIVTFNGSKVAGITKLRYLNASSSPVSVQVVAGGEDESGNEMIVFGSSDATNAYLYQMDQGTSFDGGAVTATLFVAYNNLKSPSYNKQFKKVVVELDGSNGAIIQYNALFDYSSGISPSGISKSYTLTTGGGYWDAAVWDAFSWASDDVSLVEGDLEGVGRNIGLQMQSVGTYVEPHTAYGITYHYKYRRLVK